MKEPNTLPDIQQSQDERGISLNNVGVSKVEMPVRFADNNRTQSLTAEAKLHVGLADVFKGTHMSRFIVHLHEWTSNNILTLDQKELLHAMANLLHSTSAGIDLAFTYFLDKKAPVTEKSAPMAFPCTIKSQLDISEGSKKYETILNIKIPVSTCCPCSKAISDFGAHNQRAIIDVSLNLDTEYQGPFSIQNIIESLEECSSSPVYPLLKRPDEKHVTEAQYTNPKFVEDVARDAVALLRGFQGINGFALEVESLESIHGHNAFAGHSENFRNW